MRNEAGSLANQSTGIYQVPSSAGNRVRCCEEQGKADQRGRPLSPGHPAPPARTPFSLSFSSFQAKSLQFLGPLPPDGFCSCCNNIDPSQVSLTIPKEVWRKGSEELKLAPLRSCYSFAVFNSP